MAKVMVEIEIPDGHEVVDEPQMVEWSNTVAGKVRSFAFRVTARPVKPLLICGQPAEWPEWLDCDWVAKREDGSICGFQVIKPRIINGQWCGERGWEGFELVCVNIDIPGPWDESLRENPRRKKWPSY